MGVASDLQQRWHMANNAETRAIRTRMERTGEPYNVARRALENMRWPLHEQIDAATRQVDDRIFEGASSDVTLEDVADLAVLDPSLAARYVQDVSRRSSVRRSEHAATRELFEEWGLDSPYASDDHRRDPDWGFGGRP